MGDFIAGQFRTVPDWVLESDISDGALRLYMVMLKFADNNTGSAWPGRKLLASKVGRSEKSVDRYIDELESIRAVTVEPRWKPGSSTERTSNLYHVHHVPGVATPVSPPSPQECRHPLPTDVAVTRTNELEPMNAPASRKQRAHRIPDNWEPNPTHQAKANEKNLDLAHEAETFRNHAQAHDRRLVDWDAGFRNWLTKAKPRPPQGRRNDSWMNLSSSAL